VATKKAKEYAKKLKKSRQESQKMKDYFGLMPLSVLRGIPKSFFHDKLFYFQNNGQNSNLSAQEKRVDELSSIGLTKKEIISLRTTKLGCGRGKPGLSIMPPNIVEFFIKYYCHPGGLYFDPFAGQGIQMQVAKILGVDYIGYDISKKFMAFNNSVKEKINDGKTKIELFNRDSRKIHLPENSVDFCFTSPPYWNIEDYGDEPEQLGKNTYDGFLAGMGQIAKELYRVFKPGCYCVINVNDFRMNGKFYNYHGDTIELFTRAGWEHHDIWILETGIAGLPRIFARDFNNKKISPKIHEYALVFKK